MRRTLRWILLVTVLIGLPVQAEVWVLALSWAPGFCASHAEKKQCRDLPDPDNYAARHLTIHGLWPSAQNCPAPPLRPEDLPAGLARIMPGIQDGLAEHEWRKHGSCSGMQPRAYFQQMMDMAEQVNFSSLGRYLNENASARVTLSELRAALRPDYPKGSDSVRFICGGERLVEVRFYLNGWSDWLGQGSRRGLWGRTNDKDRCDESIML